MRSVLEDRSLASLALPLGLVLTLLPLAGCQHQHLAQERAQTRLDRFASTPAYLAESEAGRPQRFVGTADYFGWYFRHQTEEFGANAQAAAGQFLGRDVQRAGERLPADGKEAVRMLYGRPERIEENAILLFF